MSTSGFFRSILITSDTFERLVFTEKRGALVTLRDRDSGDPRR